MIVRGVPKRLAKDAWWLNDDGPKRCDTNTPLDLCARVIGLTAWRDRDDIDRR